MKKTIILAMLCILSSLSMRAGDYQYLVFTLSDGTTQAVTASDLSISFTGDNLVATCGNETVATLPLASLTSMEFSNDGTTGISSALFTNSSNSEGEWFDLNGRKLDGTPTARGVYILKNASKTIKVTIR